MPLRTQTLAPERMDALQSGMVKPTAAEMGHRVDLPEVMRARMEDSFGADFSNVKLYESQTVADAGANAVAQGSSIAFAPGKLDFTSFGGQALLGHELSHVVSQQRGEVTGGGFLNDYALEARADREGAMAARGESVYGGASAPLSAASAAPAAGPMQAMRDREQEEMERLGESRAELKDKGQFDQAQEDRYHHLRHKAMDEDYRGAKWGLGKRIKNWFRTRKTTGLSNKRMDVNTRMNLDMMDMFSMENEQRDDDFDTEMEELEAKKKKKLPDDNSSVGSVYD